MRPPSVFSEVNVKPSFLRTTPAKKPRTECCCHPVAFMIAAIVVPLGCDSNASTAPCLVSGFEAGPTFVSFAALLALLGFAGFLLLAILRRDMLGPSWLRRHQHRHHRSPAVAARPAGRYPGQPVGLLVTSTHAPFAV